MVYETVCGARAVAGWPGIRDGRSPVLELSVGRARRAKIEMECEGRSTVEVSVLYMTMWLLKRTG